VSLSFAGALAGLGLLLLVGAVIVDLENHPMIKSAILLIILVYAITETIVTLLTWLHGRSLYL
jgi:hypothetical protein